MSWSVSAIGNSAEVKLELDRQFAWPLADKPAGLSDDGERETVKRIQETITQCVGTFDPALSIVVSANGHMSGASQTVAMSIRPGSK